MYQEKKNNYKSFSFNSSQMKAQKTQTEHPSGLFITDNFRDFGRMPEAVENNIYTHICSPYTHY